MQIWYYSLSLKNKKVWKVLLRMMQKFRRYGLRSAHLWA
ncbi:hypothetical protein E2C01_057659 [Portunus trituberculatus]|uniref:Uncharacterized protein n=1 Tax=Portunus trituberculatus TaxID=210409 RepID=A0A5B7GU50_PORTR|nr:hypothetical protein [Portunus trituberculatus]